MFLHLPETGSAQCNFAQGDHREGSRGFSEQVSGLRSFSKESQVRKTFGASTISDLSFIKSENFTQVGSPTNSSIYLETNLQNVGEELEALSSERSYSVASLKSEQVEF